MLFDRQWPTRVFVAAVLIALVTAGVGVWLLVGAGGYAGHPHVTVGGVPLDEVHPHETAAGVRRPGVVVAHGCAGSARLMAQFGDSLAARGYVVVLLDFSGHGANTRPLPDGAATTAALQHDLDVAVTHLRGLPDVDPARIALVGHSMGASAVTQYAAAHPEITATVAISLPSAPAEPPDRLLALVGQFEFPGFRAEAERATAGGAPGRSMIVVPGVEHISILYAPRAHRETAAFLDDSFGQTTADRPMPSPLRRAGGAGALLVSLLVGLYPVGWLLLGGIRQGWSRLTLPQFIRTVVVAAVACAVAAVVARWLPTERLPLSIGNYLVGFTVTGGAAMLAYQSPSPTAPISRPGGRRLALAAPILIGYAAVTVAVPLNLGLTYAVPVGNRYWLLPVVWAGFALLAYAGDRLAAGNFLGLLTVSMVALAAVTGAAVTGLTSGFVLLIVPLLAVLLLVQAAWAAILHRFAAPRWLIAAVGSLIVAWPIAVALPVTG